MMIPTPPEIKNVPSKELSKQNFSKIKLLIFGIIIGIALTGIAFCGFYFGQIFPKNINKTDILENVPPKVISDRDLEVSPAKDEKIESDALLNIPLSKYSIDTQNENKFKNFTPSLDGKQGVIKWIGHAEPLAEDKTVEFLAKIQPINSAEIFERNRICKTLLDKSPEPEYAVLPTYCDIHIFKAGHLVSPINRELYFITSPLSEMGKFWETYIAFYDPDYKKFIALTKEDETLNSWSDFAKNWFEGYIEVPMPELVLPNFIDIPNQKSKLKFVKFLELPDNGPWDQKGTPLNRGGILDVVNKQIVRVTDKDIVAFIDPKHGPVYEPIPSKGNGYRVFLPDGSVAEYDIQPYFFKPLEDEAAEKNYYSAGHFVDIDFKNSRHENERYELSGTILNGKCISGVVPCTNIITNEAWFSKSKKVAVGVTSGGDTVYELADKETNSYYKELFEFGYGGAKVMNNDFGKPIAELTVQEQWKEFINDQPLFFWQDHRGDWRVYKKKKYMSAAECGKPVIYLYPEKETLVNVRVEPNGGFTFTEPVYGESGWNVRALPDGQLFDINDKNKKYPYLFWEGIGYNYDRPDNGFVMSREEVGARMREILDKLGLVENEIIDFMEFWQPRLESSPYVMVNFLPQSEFEQLAPLTVNPIPDTVIRIFMDYIPLEFPIFISEPDIVTPVRKGFTVVEWGGALHE